MRSTRHVTGVVAGAFALLALGTARADDYEGIPNPHGAPDGCLSCHAPATADTAEEEERGDEAVGRPMQVGEPLPVVATCRSCHPTADMHPVGMEPRNVKPHEGWPLEDGKVVCSTCHLEKAHDPEEYADLSEPWHRGGPYETITDFCYQCHESTAYTRTDPHHPAEAYLETDPTCAACHSGAPERGAAPEESHLRIQAARLCQTCHKGDTHYGAREHLDAAVDELVRPQLPEGVVIMKDGSLRCFSCHDVHAGVDAGKIGTTRLAQAIRSLGKEEWTEVPEGAIWPGEEHEHGSMLSLPLRDGALCVACHGDGPE